MEIMTFRPTLQETAQYESSDSPIKKVTVQGGTTFALTTTTATDTSLTLKLKETIR